MALLKLKERVYEAIVACEDFTAFSDIESDLNVAFARNWAPMAFGETGERLVSKSAGETEFVVICVRADDQPKIEVVSAVIRTAASKGIGVVLVTAEDVPPQVIHQLFRIGAQEFVPYPLPENELIHVISRVRNRQSAPAQSGSAGERRIKGAIIPVYGVAGGVGSSVFATNLAWELAEITRKTEKRIALVDLDVQYGSISTYLDLQRRNAVFDLLTFEYQHHIAPEILSQALLPFEARLAVLTSPPDPIPFDMVQPETIRYLLETAAKSYDYVIVDMPTVITHWSGTVLQMSEMFFVIMELELRSAQNLMRFIRTVKSEDLPIERIQYVLNRAPGFTDMKGKSRIKRLSDSLNININLLLPEGGKDVLTACDQGLPLAELAPKNPLRKEIRKIGAKMIEMAEEAKAAIA